MINPTIGAWCFDYVLASGFGKDVPWYWDVIGGLFLGEFTIPLAVITFILRLAGVQVPFFH